MDNDRRMRILSLQRVIIQTFNLMVKTQNDLEKRLQSLAFRNELHTKVESMEMRVRIVQKRIECEKMKCKLKSDVKLSNESDICEKGCDMLNKLQQIKAERERLHEKRRKCDECRERLVKVKAQLTLQRKLLISELSKIYQMIPFPDGRGGFSILDVHLPNSEGFDGHDDVMLSIAIGYVSHFLVITHRFLDIPMRYNITYFASRSTIYDHNNEKLREIDRHFPLHSKSGKHKLYFKYGMFLLNKNIAQLRQYFGLPTHDLSATLPNLYNLLHEKLLIGDDENGIDLNASVGANSSVSFSSHVNDYLRREMEFMRHEFDQQNGQSHAGPSSSINNSFFRRKLSTVSNNSMQTHSDRSISVSLDKGLNEIVITKKDRYARGSDSSTSSHAISSVPKHLLNSSIIHQNFSESELHRVRGVPRESLQYPNDINNVNSVMRIDWPNSSEDEMNNGTEMSSCDSSPRINTIDLHVRNHRINSDAIPETHSNLN